jgi:hypothetical protein
VKLVAPHALQPYDLLRHDRLFLSKDAAVRLGETLGLGPRPVATSADVVSIEPAAAKPAEHAKAAKPASKEKKAQAKKATAKKPAAKEKSKGKK